MAKGTIKSKIARISGWYLEDSRKDRRKNAAPEEAEDRVRLGDLYVHSVRRWDLEHLEISEVKKFAGSFWNPIRVRGVIDLKSGALEKFYIKEEDVDMLQVLLDVFHNGEVLVGNKKLY